MIPISGQDVKLTAQVQNVLYLPDVNCWCAILLVYEPIQYTTGLYGVGLCHSTVTPRSMNPMTATHATWTGKSAFLL